MGILDALRRTNNGATDAMRQTTTLTMAYLLEQNRQFEAYMREKVEELEARVAAQQARASVKIDGVDEATRPMTPAAVLDRTQPAAPPGEVDDDILSFFSADFELDEAEEEIISPPVTETEAQPGVKAEETAPPEWVDWEAVLLGSPVTTAAAPVESGGAANELTTEDEPVKSADETTDLDDPFRPAWLQAHIAEVEAEIKADVTNVAPAVEVSDESLEKETEAEETEVTLPLIDGPVEDWA